jgi:hypothetical protein
MTPIADLLCLWELVRIMRRERFDVVHTEQKGFDRVLSEYERLLQ